MDFSPIIYVKCALAAFTWLVFFLLVIKRKDIERLAQSIHIQRLTVDLLNTELQMKLHPVGPERMALFEKCDAIKSELRTSSGLPSHCTSNTPNENSTPENVVSLHAKRLNKRVV